MAVVHGNDQDRSAALKKVSAELDELVSNRAIVPFTDAEQARYEALCEREQELLSQTERPPDSFPGASLLVQPGRGRTRNEMEVTAVPGGLLEELSDAECVRLLGRGGVGRVAVVVDDYPVVVPVNYRVIEVDQGVVVVVRTQPGSVIDGALNVGFQVDGVDAVHRVGWSVLVRGLLGHIDDADVALLRDEIDPEPWVADRRSWLVIRPTALTGRRLRATEVEWAFSLRAYL